mmetsp:Transcript_49014/g.142049  ORF Transcript_49014/g.142049 Transcript_49014/m.142049 type:complete len:419 (-) Transcript_49014:1322-2578(-)
MPRWQRSSRCKCGSSGRSAGRTFKRLECYKSSGVNSGPAPPPHAIEEAGLRIPSGRIPSDPILPTALIGPRASVDRPLRRGLEEVAVELNRRRPPVGALLALQAPREVRVVVARGVEPPPGHLHVRGQVGRPPLARGEDAALHLEDLERALARALPLPVAAAGRQLEGVLLAPALLPEDGLQLVPVGDAAVVGDRRAEAAHEGVEGRLAEAGGREAQLLDVALVVLELDQALLEDVHVLHAPELVLPSDCGAVDVVVRVRALLSWERLPPCLLPGQLTFNVLDSEDYRVDWLQCLREEFLCRLLDRIQEVDMLGPSTSFQGSWSGSTAGTTRGSTTPAAAAGASATTSVAAGAAGSRVTGSTMLPGCCRRAVVKSVRIFDLCKHQVSRVEKQHKAPATLLCQRHHLLHTMHQMLAQLP